MLSDLMNDAPLRMVTALSPAECTARLASALELKVWIVSGETRWESNYVTGKVTPETLLLRNHTFGGDSPTYATASIEQIGSETIIAGAISYDRSSRWGMKFYRGCAVLVGLVGLGVATHLIYAGLTGVLSAGSLLHRPYRIELWSLAGVGYVYYMGRLPLTMHRAEGKSLRRFLGRIFEAREEQPKDTTKL